MESRRVFFVAQVVEGLGEPSLRHDLPLHAAIYGYDLAAVISDVKALIA